MIETLEPREGPEPQASSYHSYVAPEPLLPPAAVKVVELPSQIEELPVIDVGAVGGDSTFIVITEETAEGQFPLVTVAL